jgi:hypothetical protein
MEVQSIANGKNIVARISIQQAPSNQHVDFSFAHLNRHAPQAAPSPFTVIAHPLGAGGRDDRRR